MGKIPCLGGAVSVNSAKNKHSLRMTMYKDVILWLTLDDQVKIWCDASTDAVSDLKHLSPAALSLSLST